MKSVQFDRPGPPDVMYLKDVEIPKLKNNQILIKVKFAGLNRPDIVQREGNYPPPPNHSPILGLEVSGVISKVGRDVKSFKTGEKVAALVNGGGYAEYCVADQETSFKVPNKISLKEAAGIPECFFTVWSNLVVRGNLKKNQKVLVHGGTSGIGITSIQILNMFKAEIFTTVGSEEKKNFCKKLGVKHVFNYKKQDYYEEIKKNNKNNLDLILDYIGGDYIKKNVDLLGTEGKLINIGFQNGAVANLNFMKVMLKRLTITGSTLRIRDIEFKAKILKDLKENVFPHLENGSIKCYIDSVYKIDDVVSAHQKLQEGNHIGKVILEL